MKKNKFQNIFIFSVFIFLYFPIIILVLFSFNSSKYNIIFSGFTLDWYRELLSNKDLIEAFRNTFLIACISTIVSTILGTLGAIGLKKFSFKGKKIINELLYIPIIIPEIVMGIALLSMFTLLKLNLGLFSIIISHIAFSIPFVLVSVRSSLNSLPSTIEDAAKDLGANDFQTLTKIILPSISSGILSGAFLAFTLSMDDVVISYFTAGPGSNTLPLYIYSMIKTGVTPDVNALTSILLVVVINIIIIRTVVVLKKERRKKK